RTWILVPPRSRPSRSLARANSVGSIVEAASVSCKEPTIPGRMRGKLGAMTTLLITDTSFLGHDTGPYHPEQPARLESVLEGLSQSSFHGLDQREAKPVAREDVARV